MESAFLRIFKVQEAAGMIKEGRKKNSPDRKSDPGQPGTPEKTSQIVIQGAYGYEIDQDRNKEETNGKSRLLVRLYPHIRGRFRGNDNGLGGIRVRALRLILRQHGRRIGGERLLSGFLILGYPDNNGQARVPSHILEIHPHGVAVSVEGSGSDIFTQSIHSPNWKEDRSKDHRQRNGCQPDRQVLLIDGEIGDTRKEEEQLELEKNQEVQAAEIEELAFAGVTLTG
jgi:hypothetical protein